MKRFVVILENYCEEIGIPPEKIKGRDRHVDVDTARKVFWKVMHDKGLSRHFLARMFNRDVLTIRRGIERANNFLSISDKGTIYYAGICEKVAKWE